MRRIALLAALCVPLTGCLSMDETPEDSRDIPTTAFVRGSVPEGVRPSVVEVPASEFTPDPDEMQDTTVQVDASGNASTSVTRTLRAPGAAPFSQIAARLRSASSVPQAVNAARELHALERKLKR